MEPLNNKTNLHVMVDVETWGRGNKAAIIALGAVKFHPREGTTVDQFYAAVEPSTSVALGLEMDADTVMWWMHPDQFKAHAEWFKSEKVDLASALEGFSEWYGETSLPTWGNGATFDNVIMTSAYRAIGRSRPWGFRHDRCYRTLRALMPKDWSPLINIATPHHALGDAQAQAHRLISIVSLLGINPQ